MGVEAGCLGQNGWKVLPLLGRGPETQNAMPVDAMVIVLDVVEIGSLVPNSRCDGGRCSEGGCIFRDKVWCFVYCIGRKCSARGRKRIRLHVPQQCLSGKWAVDCH